MAGSWLWQSSQQQIYPHEAGAHSLFHQHQHHHYTLATHHPHQHVPQPPHPPPSQPCYCSFNLANTISYAPMPTSYATCVPTSCVNVGIPMLKRPSVPCHQHQFQSAMGHVQSTPETVTRPEDEWKHVMDENGERKPKRRCYGVDTHLTTTTHVQPFSAAKQKSDNPIGELNGPRELKSHQIVRKYDVDDPKPIIRSRRVTRRVGGKRTPQPYQRRKGRPLHKRAIQSNILQVPGEHNYWQVHNFWYRYKYNVPTLSMCCIHGLYQG